MTSTTDRIVFLGVTTAGSVVRTVFPRWMELLGVEAKLETIDLPVRAPADAYRAVIESVRDRPEVRGAQITAHKTAVYEHAAGVFAGFSDLSRRCREVSVVVCQDGALFGTAVEPITIGQTLEQLGRGRSIVSPTSDLVISGAGGTAVSFLACLTAAGWPATARPRSVHLVDIDRRRLRQAAETAATGDRPLVVVPHATDGETSLADLGPLAEGSVIVNATGLGKDRPGTPFTLPAPWPVGAHVWDLNYRGDLLMLESARRADPALHLHVHDGWRLFINGWAESLALILDRPITVGERQRMDELGRSARS